MNEHCLTLVNSVKNANKKISMDDLLDLCDEYDLSPNEVEWVTNALSVYLSDSVGDSEDDATNSFSQENVLNLIDISSIEVLEVDRNLTELPDYFGAENEELSEIRIPDGIKSIGDYCFSKCSNLRTVVFPKSLTSIESGAFAWCTQLRKLIFLGDLPQEIPANPKVLVVYGRSKNASGIFCLHDTLVILLNESIKKWPESFSNFAVVRGFAYAISSGLKFSDKILRENGEYISNHRDQLFYYAVVRNDRIILRYLIDNNQLPEKIMFRTLEHLLYDDYRKEIKEKVQIVSQYTEIHPLDDESEWGYKTDSKRNVTIMQFRGYAVDCVEVPPTIKGCPVTRIGPDVFSSINPRRGCIPEETILRREVRRIVLPTSVKRIDQDAFSGCEYVTIYIPHTVENINSNAFGSSSSLDRLRLIVEKGSKAELFAITNKMQYYYDYPEYDQTVNFIISRVVEKKRGRKKKVEEDNGPFQSGLEIIVTKEDPTPFAKSPLQVSAEGYGTIGTVSIPRTMSSLPARKLGEKFFCVDADYLSSIIDDKMNAKIIEAYPEYAVCALLKK